MVLTTIDLIRQPIRVYLSWEGADYIYLYIYIYICKIRYAIRNYLLFYCS